MKNFTPEELKKLGTTTSEITRNAYKDNPDIYVIVMCVGGEFDGYEGTVNIVDEDYVKVYLGDKEGDDITITDDELDDFYTIVGYEK